MRRTPLSEELVCSSMELQDVGIDKSQYVEKVIVRQSVLIPIKTRQRFRNSDIGIKQLVEA